MKKVAALLLLAALLAPALAAATPQQKPVVVFDQGHGQYYDSRKLSMFLNDLKKSYYVVINKDKLTSDDLSKAVLLIVPNPRSYFKDDELKAVRQFVEKSGVLLVMGDWYKYINARALNKLVEGTGIEFTVTEVMDNNWYDYKPYFPLVGVWAESDAAKFVSERVGKKKVKYNGCMLKVSQPAEPVLLSLGTSYVVDKGGKKIATGNVPVVAVSRLGKGVVIAIGGSRVASTKYFYEKKVYGNRELLLSLIEWALRETGALKTELEARATVVPSLAPVGKAVSVNVTVSVKNLGASIDSAKVVLESDFWSGEKEIGSIAQGEEKSVSFTFEASSPTPGPKTIKVRVVAGEYTVEREVTIYFAEKASVVLLDSAHGEYYGADDMRGFVELLSSEVAPVVESTAELNEETLSLAKVVVLPNPERPLSSEEVSALKKWLEGGGVLIIAGNYYRYFDPSIHGAITLDYGIAWLDGSVRDKQHSLPGKDYAVFAGNFADNKVARALSSGVEKVFFSGTALEVRGEAVPVLVGWDTTVVVNEKGVEIAKGEKVVLVAAAKTGKGMIFALGGVSMLLDERYNVSIFEMNRRFLENILSYRPKPPVYIPSLEVTLQAPASLEEGEEGTLVVEVSNKGNGTASSVVVRVFAEGVALEKEQVSLGDIPPGDKATASLKVTAAKPGTAAIKVTVVASNHSPISKEAKIEVKAKPPKFDVGMLVAVAVIVVVVVAVAVRSMRKKRAPSASK